METTKLVYKDLKREHGSVAFARFMYSYGKYGAKSIAPSISHHLQTGAQKASDARPVRVLFWNLKGKDEESEFQVRDVSCLQMSWHTSRH